MKTKFYIALGAVIGGLGLLVGLFVFLFLTEILPLSEEFASVRRDIRVSESKITYMRRVVEPGVERSGSELAAVRSLFYVPSNDNAYEMILFMESVAKARGVTLKISTPPSESASGMNIQIDGRFADVFMFLRALENESHLLRIDTLSLNGSGGTLGATIGLILQTL